jgi:hypothetical protein
MIEPLSLLPWSKILEPRGRQEGSLERCIIGYRESNDGARKKEYQKIVHL